MRYIIEHHSGDKEGRGFYVEWFDDDEPWQVQADGPFHTRAQAQECARRSYMGEPVTYLPSRPQAPPEPAPGPCPSCEALRAQVDALALALDAAGSPAHGSMDCYRRMLTMAERQIELQR